MVEPRADRLANAMLNAERALDQALVAEQLTRARRDGALDRREALCDDVTRMSDRPDVVPKPNHDAKRKPVWSAVVALVE